MSDRPVSPNDPDLPEPVPAVEQEPTTPEKQEITTGRRMLWMVGGGVGAFMILQGVWGLIKDDEGEEEERP